MVSGASVVNSKEIWQRIVEQHKDVLALDMEAFAIAMAARNAARNPKLLVAKAVSDLPLGRPMTVSRMRLS